MTLKRGLTHQESMEYVGVKRRTFDELWRPKLVAMRQGSSLVFDRVDLDRLFEEFKQEAAGHSSNANDSSVQPIAAQNKGQNIRPIKSNGVQEWDKARVVSIKKSAVCGKSTNGSSGLDFASAASKALMMRNAG